MIKRGGWIILLLIYFLLTPRLSVGQDIFVGPDGKFEEQTLSVPYAFYNESFGAAVAYAYGKVGYPQKQSAILGTIMAGSKGLVARIDVAGSDEGFGVAMMVSQPFQF